MSIFHQRPLFLFAEATSGACFMGGECLGFNLLLGKSIARPSLPILRGNALHLNLAEYMKQLEES